MRKDLMTSKVVGHNQLDGDKLKTKRKKKRKNQIGKIKMHGVLKSNQLQMILKKMQR